MRDGKREGVLVIQLARVFLRKGFIFSIMILFSFFVVVVGSLSSLRPGEPQGQPV